jgi:hypothetical protein
VTFNNGGQTLDMPTLSSWTDDARFLYYSGQATYRKSIDISEINTQPGHSVTLDFGDGIVVARPSPLGRFNMRAYLEGPVREAAQVYANDQFAGYVWCPPYRIELTPLLKPGKNELRIVVGNTAINELAGESLPDYRLLRDRYGLLFETQDMQNLGPLPSGIIGKVTLVVAAPDF